MLFSRTSPVPVELQDNIPAFRPDQHLRPSSLQLHRDLLFKRLMTIIHLPKYQHQIGRSMSIARTQIHSIMPRPLFLRQEFRPTQGMMVQLLNPTIVFMYHHYQRILRKQSRTLLHRAHPQRPVIAMPASIGRN